ncbi:MAG TPA: hypothetical protein VH107_21410 [Lacipirellulaceae bacterium]|jgi:hypothetical protein|nr:hypothetical protein [Lacipirellulaceae bacterium]
MKRVELEADQMPGQDSFLDVITNIVGILILLVLVVGLRTSHSVRDVPDALQAERARGEAEYQQAYSSALTRQRGVQELVARVGNTHNESAFRESERDWLSTNVAAAENEIKERRAKLTADGQRDFDQREKLATAQATLDEMTREQIALMSRDSNTEQLECQPTPVAKAVSGKEIHVLLSDDHVAIVPFDELLDQMKEDARANVWRMKQQSGLERTIGPMNGFRLKYYFVREDVVGKSQAGTYMTGSVSRFSHCYLLPETTPVGEPAKEALQPNSEFFQQLQHLRPDTTTITFWTYPGNFERLRELKHAVRQMGFPIAVRPLPMGMPIGASRHGSDSLSE